jgi:putative hemolysin
VSIESWIDGSVLILAFLLLCMAGLVDASLNKRQRLTIRELLDNGTNSSQADDDAEHSSELRSAVDVATFLSVLATGAVVTHTTIRLFSIPWLLLVVPVTLLLVIFIGRLIPVLIAGRFGMAESPVIERIATTIAVLMGPFVIVLQGGRLIFDRSASTIEQDLSINTDFAESRHYESDSSDQLDPRELQADEHEMITGILSLEDAFAREIMVPRPDMVAVAIDTPIPDVVRTAQNAGHSRIPVYEETIDRIRGIVYAKDLLRFVNDDVTGVNLADLMRPAQFVPESKRIDDLLHDLQRARVHLAIVVDEYGGTAGLVTIEDIIEEIVGEIQDEYDREMPLFEYGTAGDVLVDGRMNVGELSELLGLTLPETESETVGGLVARALGHIPEQGDVAVVGPVKIQVERVERRRVRSIRVWFADQPAAIDTHDPLRVS